MFEGIFGKKAAPVEEGQGDIEQYDKSQTDERNIENEWRAGMVAGQKSVEPNLTTGEMIQPDAPLKQEFARGGYEGSAKFDESEQVPLAEEGEFLTPFQKQQRLDAMKKTIQEGEGEREAA